MPASQGGVQPAKTHTHTTGLTPAQAAKLRRILEARGFDFQEKPYTLFSARKDKLVVSVYEKGPKVLIQGKGLEDFITFVLEPEILERAEFGYEEQLEPERFEPHFGIDETGKGDFFGPLVVAGVHCDADSARLFRDLGIQDSKRIASDARIRTLAAEIRRSRTAQTVIVIAPARYNELYRKIGNLNRLLAWGHARAIENLCEIEPDCPRALSDQFASPALLQRSLMAKGRTIQLDQRTKAESDPAVAAASILAREKLIDWFQTAARHAGESRPFPRGASAAVKQRALELVQQRGPSILPTLVKMHFKTAAEVLALAAGGGEQK